ncbi:MAG: asparagine synthase B, partial [Acidobacteriota bacterium]
NMCGIAGIWGTVDEEVIRVMMLRLVHRGPDSQGILRKPERRTVLGHRRLAVIDPAGGDQPIRSEDGHQALVANGEIYNFRSLRSRLKDRHRFQTQSDSEVVLALYAERGTACASDLDGMFAFALADGDDLFVARDPIGIKPLYFGRRNGNLLFASEIKALIGLAEEIREFPPGSWFHSRIGTRIFYEVPDRTPVERTVKETVARVRETLERSVTKRLMSDVPLGAFLSGGLDSSIIAALIRPHVDKLHTFSVGIEGSRDLQAARTVANHLDTVHHEHVLKPEEIAASLSEILFHLESFDQDLVRSAIPCYFAARLASQEVKVILTGEGADELFAGYRYYRDYEDPALLQRELRRSIRSLHNINLQRVDRMTMAHSIEGRVPFLDVEMIELAQTIPPELKLKKNGGPRLVEKWVLRKACEDLLPAEIVWRYKEQFDEGSGTVELLREAIGRWMPAGEAGQYSRHHPIARLRSPEECLYHKLLCEAYTDPTPIITNVSRWADREVGDAV